MKPLTDAGERENEVGSPDIVPPAEVAKGVGELVLERQEACRQLEAFGCDRFTFQTFDDDKDRKDKRLAQVLHGTFEQHADHLERLNRQGAGIFFMVNAGNFQGRAMKNVTTVRALFIDTDGRVPLQDTYALEPSMVVESSPGKWHVYWFVSDVPLDKFSDLQVGLATIHGTDPSVKDLPRVMRLAGSYHRKLEPPQRVRIDRWAGNTYMLEQVLSAWPTLASSLKEKQQQKQREAKRDEARGVSSGELQGGTPALDIVVKRLAKACDEIAGAKEGGRNNLVYKAAYTMGGYVASGIIDEALVGMKLRSAAEACGLSAEEARAAVENGVKAGAVEPLTVDLLEYPQTDYGNAERLFELQGGEFRYCHALGFLIWDGKRWQVDEDGNAMKRKALMAARRLTERAVVITEDDKYDRREWLKYAMQGESATALKNAVELVKSIPGVGISPSALDTDPMKLSVENGTIDLNTGKLERHNPADLITKLAPVTYDPTAKCPKWLEFQQTICAGDDDLMAFKQRAYGYSLTGKTTEQVLFILYGSGANGKSTEMGVVRDLMGEYAKTAQFDTFAQKQSEAIPADVADLAGARFVPASEGEKRQRLAEAFVKQMTGGDEVKARFLHKNFFTFQPAFKIWLATNNKPVIRGVDKGIWRRIRLVPYTVTIPDDQQNRELPDELKAENSGILNWLLEGCRLWRTQGLRVAKAVKDATESYRQESDVLADFITTRCVVDPVYSEVAGDLYRAYVSWCEVNGDDAFNSNLFGRMLTERGYITTQARKNGKSVKVRIGICLAENAQGGVLPS